MSLVALATSSTPLLLVQLTPSGRGAVATLRIEGASALEAVARHFVAHSGRPLADCALRQIVVGRFGESGEEVVVSRIADDAIELHCHGGRAAVARLEAILVHGGCRQVSWQEWSRGRQADPFTAAAELALADARTARTAAILLDQRQGALRRAVQEIEAALRKGEVESARRRIETLLAHSATGLHLTRPWQVVVAGRPNAGKSSLINAIAGYQRAIVHSLPGTTRDIVAVHTAMDGWPVEISDTAGLRETDELLERTGIDLARRKILAADLVVLVFDGSLGWSDADEALAATYPAALRVNNKSDLPSAPGPRPAALAVSAATAANIDALCRAIAARLVPHPPRPGEAVPFEPEQIEQICGCLGGHGIMAGSRPATAFHLP